MKRRPLILPVLDLIYIFRSDLAASLESTLDILWPYFWKIRSGKIAEK